ncbi:hypothetical protein QBC43DRAFT_107664 [Cladorrhinum sp. PSN259]|nr:hypothetical protein QBC43DRAFT_107664 [Cladorrhinum sp. PSN259]
MEGLSLSKDIKRGTDEMAERLEHMSAQLDHLSRQSGFANRYDFLQPNCSRSSTHHRIDHDIGETTDTTWQDCGSSSYHSLNSTDIMDTCRTASPAVQDPISAPFPSSSWWSGSTLLSDESAYSQTNAAPEWNNHQFSVLETEEMGASLSLRAEDNPWTESNQSLSWYPSALIDICPPALSPIAQLEKQPQVDPSTESIRDRFKRRVKALAPSRQSPTSTSSFSNSTSWYEKPRKTTNPTAKRFLEQVKLKARSTNTSLSVKEKGGFNSL